MASDSADMIIPTNVASQIKGVLFDMDGTLIESMDIWFEILRAATLHFKATPLTYDVWHPTAGQSQQKNIELFMPHVSLSELDAYCAAHYHAYTDKLVVLDGAPETVSKAFEKANGRCIIVTNCPRPITEQIVDGHKARFLKESFGWEKIVCSDDVISDEKSLSVVDASVSAAFATGGGGDDAADDGIAEQKQNVLRVPPKPHPAMLYYAAAMLGLKPSECMMVGDSKWDMLAGKTAGCALTVGINVDGGDLRIKSIADVEKLLAAMDSS